MLSGNLNILIRIWIPYNLLFLFFCDDMRNATESIHPIFCYILDTLFISNSIQCHFFPFAIRSKLSCGTKTSIWGIKWFFTQMSVIVGIASAISVLLLLFIMDIQAHNPIGNLITQIRKVIAWIINYWYTL